MQIDRVTITGADNLVNVNNLARLGEMYPLVEWGILFSMNKEGQDRYPNGRKINEFADKLPNLSAHFCGHYSREVLEKYNIKLLDQWKGQFKRFQLNYNFQNGNNYAFAPVIDWAINNPDNSIIFQYNKSNKIALSEWLAAKLFPSNVHVLYDSSGGRGTELADIDGKMPFHGHYTGYSGGINPANIKSVIYQLEEIEFKDKVWIDMESGVRTDNKFDIDKVMSVLATCKNFIQ